MRVADTQLFELEDGRELAWIEYGAVDGSPVMAFHGSGGTRHHFASQADVAAGKGVRLIAPDRPGYGHSTYDPRRTYETWTCDVARLADHLGLERFAVLGHSAGGPNAAACARFLGDRLVGCAVVSGFAPPDAKVSMQGTLRINRILQRVSPVAPRLTTLVFSAEMRQAQRAPDRALIWMSRILPACDSAVIARPEVRTAVRADLVRQPSPTAARAATQDTSLEQRPWGFNLSDIEMDVHVWHGDLDRNAVIGHGIHQANEIPHATLHRLPQEGHWLIFEHFDEILDSVTA